MTRKSYDFIYNFLDNERQDMKATAYYLKTQLDVAERLRIADIPEDSMKEQLTKLNIQIHELDTVIQELESGYSKISDRPDQ